jgi:DNA-binding transcriptional ArsR family regulator
MISITEVKQSLREDRLAALGDPTRQQILELLAERPRTASELHSAFPIAAPAVSRHLRVLREAGLVGEEQVPEDRRVRLYRLEHEALEELSAWLSELSRGWQRQLDSFRDYVSVRGSRGHSARRPR